MQSGKIKHWNADKGYGFIEVDNQSEDVFFHISTVRLSQPIGEGQRVYFNSQRNEKNQLRATEVTSNELSVLETSVSNSASNSTSNSAHRNLDNAQQKNNRYKNTRGSQNKKSGFSTLLSVIALIAVAVYFFGDLKSSLFTDSTPATSISQTASKTSSSGSAAITGDAQIDQTLALIKQGGPFPYPNKDGTTFYNREGKLPAQSQGYYRE